MENKIDKLFRDKLENHSMQPSANTWEKVAAGLPKKNNTLVWAWRMAAAVALFGIVGALIFNSLQPGKSTEMAKDYTPKVEAATPVDSNKQETKSEKVKKTIPQLEQPVAHKKVTEQTQKDVYNLSDTQGVAEVSQEIIKEKIEPVTETIVTSQEFAVAKVEETQPKIVQQKTRVLVYSLAAVESKPEEEPVKVKPFQRMLTFAKDVKGGETTLASVRNWKDNFLGTDETARIEKQNNNN